MIMVDWGVGVVCGCVIEGGFSPPWVSAEMRE